MSLRAILIGVLLGLAIAAFTHFNDHIIWQTFLVGNHLPPIVFGTALVLLLLINPLLRTLGERWMFRAGEIATIIALGLVVCGWPGSNLMRIYGHLVSVPAQQRALQPHWEAAQVFAYIPGGPPYVAEGYVKDWPGLIDGLAAAGEADAEAASAAPILAGVRAQLTREMRRELDSVAQTDAAPGTTLRQQVLRAVNQAMVSRVPVDPPLAPPASIEAIAEHNRAALDAALPGVFKPAPAG